jgi:hypothetical protein
MNLVMTVPGTSKVACDVQDVHLFYSLCVLSCSLSEIRSVWLSSVKQKRQAAEAANKDSTLEQHKRRARSKSTWTDGHHGMVNSVKEANEMDRGGDALATAHETRAATQTIGV